MILICKQTIDLLRERGVNLKVLEHDNSFYVEFPDDYKINPFFIREVHIDENVLLNSKDELMRALQEQVSELKLKSFIPIHEPFNKSCDCSGCDVLQFCAKPKSSGKRENNSAVANHNGYAETKSSGKRENNSAENSPLTYAEMKDLLAFIDGIQANDKVIPCHDKTIVAVVTDIVTGHKFYGTNGIKIDNGYCPRNTTNDKVNQGYEKCVEYCGQESHAEINAINKAIAAQPNIPLTHYQIDVYGTKQICGYCLNKLGMAGVSIGKVVNDLSQLFKEI